MNKRMILGAAMLLVLSGIGTACSSTSDTMGQESDDAQVQVQVNPGGGSGGTSGSTNAPMIDADYKIEGKTATITYKVHNFKLAGDKIDKANLSGEGHMHIKVDDVDKAMLKTEASVKLENLKPGKHVVKLSLQNNDHSPVGTEKVLNLEVK